ncbi:MAG: hypothetical protein H6506_02335 [Calditrichaeota bacterium]|nr:hypothetical protein [Calditrichota bacterium]MCB9367044.1 hypothetical protein [Calditrichota bacterium]MCB9391472.1 hypothetical protein [Calditrichota bacterium]
MNRIFVLLAVLLLLTLSGCGLVSGTAFVSVELDERIEAETGPSPLDEQFAGAVVDFTEESEWQDFSIEGVEDGCVAMDAWNRLATPISGEVWITDDTSAAARAAINSVADIEAAGGFLVFSGIALEAGPADPNVPGDAQHITCESTIEHLENVDLLVEAIQRGYFVVWGAGNESSYSFVFDGIFFGVHVTGSL